MLPIIIKKNQWAWKVMHDILTTTLSLKDEGDRDSKTEDKEMKKGGVVYHSSFKDDVLILPSIKCKSIGPLLCTFYKTELLNTSSSKCTHSLQYDIPTIHFRAFQRTLRICVYF